MKTFDDIVQGSDAWLALRQNYRCASDAPVVAGGSPKMARNELIRLMATGAEREFSDWVQKNLLDKGHEVEALARPLAEEIIGEELYAVTGADETNTYLASFDGLNMLGNIGWENKSWNEELAEFVRSGIVPLSHSPQLDHQLLVNEDMEKILFTVTDGTKEKLVHCWYMRDPERIKAIAAAWDQFHEDVQRYQPVEVLPPVVATPIRDLPALAIRVDGSLTIKDNLSAFGAQLHAFIEGLNREPQDDQQFADCESAVKALSKAEDALKAAKESALAQTTSISELCATVDQYQAEARSARLLMEKIVSAQKIKIRDDILKNGKDALAAHIEALNVALGKPYMPNVEANFAGAMKGKRTFSSLRNGVDTELARAKIAADEISRRIQTNLNLLRADATEYAFLFSDMPTIVLKPCDDFASLVKARILEHKQAEEARLAAEREKMRLEAEAKLRADTEAKARIEAEAKAKVEAEQKAKADAEEKARREIEEASRKAEAQRAADLTTKEQNKVAAVGGSQPVDASKEPASGPYRGMESGQIPAARPASLSPVTQIQKRSRPTDAQIIEVLALHYRVHELKVVEWLMDMDMESASRDAASEFTKETA